MRIEAIHIFPLQQLLPEVLQQQQQDGVPESSAAARARPDQPERVRDALAPQPAAAAEGAQGNQTGQQRQKQQQQQRAGSNRHASSAELLVTPLRRRAKGSFYTRFHNVQLSGGGITFFMPPGEEAWLAHAALRAPGKPSNVGT